MVCWLRTMEAYCGLWKKYNIQTHFNVALIPLAGVCLGLCHNILLAFPVSFLSLFYLANSGRSWSRNAARTLQCSEWDYLRPASSSFTVVFNIVIFHLGSESSNSWLLCWQIYLVQKHIHRVGVDSLLITCFSVVSKRKRWMTNNGTEFWHVGKL